MTSDDNARDRLAPIKLNRSIKERPLINALVLSEDEENWTEVDDLDKIVELLNTAGQLAWAFADVTKLTSHDVAQIAKVFGLHHLAVEDAMNTRQRPKLEPYDRHLFSVMHQLDLVNGQLEATQIACFVGRRWVLTLHAGAERTLGEASRRCFKGSRNVDQGPSYIMHHLLDTIVDDYQKIADDLEDMVETLEESALANPRAPIQSEMYSLKQRTSRLRRYVFPGERVLAAVTEAGRFSLITKRTAALFRDVHDHTLRIIDQVHTIDALSDAVIDLQRAEMADTLNETTRRLTAWAAIIAVPTFIASVFGMNFVSLPATDARGGFWIVAGIMVAVSSSLFVLFRRKDWI